MTRYRPAPARRRVERCGWSFFHREGDAMLAGTKILSGEGRSINHWTEIVVCQPQNASGRCWHFLIAQPERVLALRRFCGTGTPLWQLRKSSRSLDNDVLIPVIGVRSRRLPTDSRVCTWPLSIARRGPSHFGEGQKTQRIGVGRAPGAPPRTRSMLRKCGLIGSVK